MLRILCVLVSLSLGTQAYGEGSGYSNSASGKLSNGLTNKVTRTLTRGVQNCLRLEKVYRYDCYRSVYGLAAQQLSSNAAYDEARKVLSDVEAALANTIQRNLDPSAPRKRRGVQQFNAIKESALPRAKRDFLRSLDQAETRLLRSSSNDNVHFVKIASAINSNKVLLRSALLMLPIAPVIAAPLFIPTYLRDVRAVS